MQLPSLWCKRKMQGCKRCKLASVIPCYCLFDSEIHKTFTIINITKRNNGNELDTDRHLMYIARAHRWSHAWNRTRLEYLTLRVNKIQIKMRECPTECILTCFSAPIDITIQILLFHFEMQRMKYRYRLLYI